MNRDRVHLRWVTLFALLFALLRLQGALAGDIPPYDSGSTGVDGDMRFVTPGPRMRHAMAYDPSRGQTVLFGGVNNDETWTWDGIEWTRVASFGPSPRSEHSLSLGPAEDSILLFGGTPANSLLGDTWRWNGTFWTFLANSGPPGRREPAMVLDSNRDRVVLFGGHRNAFGPLADTWEWDGTAWDDRTTTGPESRNAHAMAFDETRGTTLLFGGFKLGQALRDMWEWDGNTWTEIDLTFQPRPSGRYLHTMVYDPDGERVLLFGGFNGLTSVGDLWQFKNDAWTQIATPGPSRRFRHGMAYDISRGRAVVYGGTGGDVDTTWEFDGIAWKEFDDTIIDLSTAPDGILNVGTFVIGAGVTVRVIPSLPNVPLRVLATGDIVIEGTLDLSGAGGQPEAADAGEEAANGPGGFPGGLGGRRFDVSGVFSSGGGHGPGGGGPSLNQVGAAGNGGGHGSQGGGAQAGAVYGNRFIQPLVGGSGGSGSASGATADGDGGGAGGGAVLLASSTRIVINGTVIADGGASSGLSAGGSGGAIRLVAPVISGNGVLSAMGGSGGSAGGDGRIRLEGYSIDQLNSDPPAFRSPPYPARPNEPKTIRIIEVGNVSVDEMPSGQLDPVPPATFDVSFLDSGPILIRLATTNLPAGRILTVRITSGSVVQVLESDPIDAGGMTSVITSIPAGVGSIQVHVKPVPPENSSAGVR